MTTTRVIFTDQIEAGTIVLRNCGPGCTAAATNHHQGTPHEYTVLGVRSGTPVNMIVMDEDGEQHPWSQNPDVAVRVRVTAPVAEAEEAR